MPVFSRYFQIFLFFYLVMDAILDKFRFIARYSFYGILSALLLTGFINGVFHPMENVRGAFRQISSISAYDRFLYRTSMEWGIPAAYRILAPGWTQQDLFADSREILRLAGKKIKNHKNIRAIYLTGYSASEKKLPRFLDYVSRNGLNAIVFDIKDITGYITYPSNVKMVKENQDYHVPIKNLENLVRKLHDRGLYSIARISQFQDLFMAKKMPQWSLKYKNGHSYNVKGQPAWMDPANEEIQEYNLRIIHEVLQSGVDEIQLDYIRYPTDGDWRNVSYRKIQSYDQKPVVITKYLQRVHSLAKAYSVKVSIDVFGVVAWQEPADILSTGQDLKIMSQAADIISPMLYPSHFGDVFSGIQNPADSPEYFLYQGCIRVKSIIPDSVLIRPWIQAFPMKVSSYNGSYITRQIAGTYRSGARGYMMWNASNKYIPYSEPDFKTTLRVNPEEKPSRKPL